MTTMTTGFWAGEIVVRRQEALATKQDDVVAKAAAARAGPTKPRTWMDRSGASVGLYSYGLYRYGLHIMAYIVVAYAVMAYIAVAYVVKADIVMSDIVMAYIVMASEDRSGRPLTGCHRVMRTD